jgi:hypothetical protein
MVYTYYARCFISSFMRTSQFDQNTSRAVINVNMHAHAHIHKHKDHLSLHKAGFLSLITLKKAEQNITLFST